MSNVKRATYVENFALDVQSDDALQCDGVDVRGGALRGYGKFTNVIASTDYLGLSGITSDYMLANTRKYVRKYTGERVITLTSRLANSQSQSDSNEVAYDVYRNAAYVAFRCDGVIRHNPNASPSTLRWAFDDDVLSLAVANERLAVLVNGGRTLRFTPVNERLFSDCETNSTVPSADLPSAVQSLVRCDMNSIYALGETCYKVTFSADERNIKVTAVASGLGAVIKRSVVTLGHRIIFATCDGLYSLRNGKVSRIFRGKNFYVKFGSDVRASVWRGKYVLTVLYGDSRRAYVLDVDDEVCCGMLHNGIVDIGVFKDFDVAVTTNGYLCKSLADEYHPVKFVRSNIGFNSPNVKLLRRLNVKTKCDCTVVFTNELGQARSYFVKGGDSEQSLRIFGMGRAFKLEITSSGETEITKLEIAAETVGEAFYGN